MATIKEWEEEVGKISVADLVKYLQALKELASWDFYAKNYPEIGNLIYILNEEKEKK